MTRKQMLQIKHNPCGNATAIKQNNHVSNGFNRSVRITNRIQSSAPLRYLFKWSSSIIPEENLLQRCKLAWCVTSAYLSVSDMALTEDGSRQSLVETCQLSSTVRHPGAACLRSFSSRKTALMPEMQSVLGACRSLWAISWCYKPSVRQKKTTKYQASTFTPF